MSDSILEDLSTLDRDGLMERMKSDLPIITGEMGTYPSEIANRSGMDGKRMSLIVSGKRKMKWSEYLSILFVLWNDDKGHEIVENMGLFPDALKHAIAAGRGVQGSDG